MRPLDEPVAVEAIASFLGAELRGIGQSPGIMSLVTIGTLEIPRSYSLMFITERQAARRLIWPPNLATCLVIVPKCLSNTLNTPHIVAADPRSAFARVVARFFAPHPASGVAATAIIDPTAKLADGVIVGQFSLVGPHSVINAGTELRNHVVIGRDVVIGANSLVKSNTIIGEEGFGITKDERGRNLRIPHLGGVIVGNCVEIGALNTICSGTIEPTVLGDYVKTDDHVHIAHNVRVGASTLIAACAEISGSVQIGEEVWLGPNCSIINGVTIGKRAVIGLAAVVVRSVAEAQTVMGNPARPATQAKHQLRALARLAEQLEAEEAS